MRDPSHTRAFTQEGLEDLMCRAGLTVLRSHLYAWEVAVQGLLEAAGLRFDVIHIPGHSPGHVVFVLPGEPTIVSHPPVRKAPPPPPPPPPP